MYLIKNIYQNPDTKDVIIQNGIRVKQLNNGETVVLNSYWGHSCITTRDNPEFTEKNGDLYMCYTNDFDVTELSRDEKKFLFGLGNFEKDNVEGYIVLIRYAKQLKSTATKIFGRHQTELIAIMQEGEQIDFGEGHKIRILQGVLEAC